MATLKLNYVSKRGSWSSASMLYSMLNRRILVLREESCQVPTPCQCRGTVKTQIYLSTCFQNYFMDPTQHWWKKYIKILLKFLHIITGSEETIPPPATTEIPTPTAGKIVAHNPPKGYDKEKQGTPLVSILITFSKVGCGIAKLSLPLFHVGCYQLSMSQLQWRFDKSTVEARTWMGNYIPLFCLDAITIIASNTIWPIPVRKNIQT